VIYEGERVSLPWGDLGGPAEALLWFAAAPLTSRVLRLPLHRRLACYTACQARLEVAAGSVGHWTLATACYGWPDSRDVAAMGELEDEELLALRDGWSAQLGVMEEALGWTTTTAWTATSG